MIEVLRADITTLAVDAVVNAANETLLGGGGVDGAIHAAAGPALIDACRLLPELRPGVRCPTGDARITIGGELSARYVIHTVGPVWQGGDHDEALSLADCYRRSLELALEHGLRSIAFPAISTGVFAYPKAAAAGVAVAELSRRTREFERIVVCCFSEDDAQLYRTLLGY